jgi:hypothetical protein
MWSRPHTLALAVTCYAVGYAMCAGSKNVATVVAGQLIYTIGNSGITFRESRPEIVRCCLTDLALRDLIYSQQSNHCGHHLVAVAGIRCWSDQLAIRDQCFRRGLYHKRDQRLQPRWLEMGCE